jgi:hypothetical protein
MQTRLEEISRALSDPESSLTKAQWAQAYADLSEAALRAVDRIAHLETQLLFYAGKDSRWPN